MRGDFVTSSGGSIQFRDSKGQMSSTQCRNTRVHCGETVVVSRDRRVAILAGCIYSWSPTSRNTSSLSRVEGEAKTYHDCRVECIKAGRSCDGVNFTINATGTGNRCQLMMAPSNGTYRTTSDNSGKNDSWLALTRVFTDCGI